MTGGLVALSIGLLAWLIWAMSKDRARLSRTVVVLGVLIAPIVVLGPIGIAAIVDQRGRAEDPARFGQIRLSLERLDLKSEFARLTMGSSPDDGLVVDGAMTGLASLTPVVSGAEDTENREDSGASDAIGELTVRAPAARDAVSSAVAIGGELVGSLALPPGSALCVGTCAGGQGQWWVLDQAGRIRFRPGAREGDTVASAKGAAAEARAGPLFPRRKPVSGVDIAAPRPWRASQAIYPLGRYLPDGGGLRSVLYQKGGWRGANWRLLPLDSNLWVALPGEAPRRIVGDRQAGGVTFRDAPLHDGDVVSLWDVRTYAFARLEDPAGRLQERRAVVIQRPDDGEATGRGVLSVRLQTPATEVVANCRAAGRLSAEQVRYPILGGAVASALDQKPTLPSPADCAKFSSTTFPTEGEVAPVFTITRLGAPWTLVGLMVAWSLGAAWLQRETWRDRAAHWALYCVLQLLLAVRFLIALSGASADPGTMQAGALIGEAAIAYVVVPILFLLVDPPGTGRRVWAASLGLFAATALLAGGLYAASLEASGATDLRSFMPSGLASAAGFLAILACAVVTLWPGQARARDADRYAASTSSSGGWVAVMTTAAVTRAVLGFLSIKERIPGLGFAVSVLYTPAIILAFSGLMAEARAQAPDRLLRRGLIFCGLLALMLAVLPILVKDNGYVIVALPIAGMAAWAAWTHFPRDAVARGGVAVSVWARLVWSAPAAGLGGLLLGILIAGAFSMGFAKSQDFDIQTAGAAAGEQQALSILERVADEDPNLLRVWMRLDPERLMRSGASDAEDLRVISRHLSGYTATLFGHGYLTPANLTVLGPVHLNDNVSAIHLMMPFGRITAAAFLLLMAILPIALARRTRRPDADGARGRYEIAGFMALWILFGVDAYMVLANLQLVPFTGRNVYLLAAASDSDLLEGTSLFFLAWFGIAWTGRGALFRRRARGEAA
jgi:hypothetical protein